MNATCSEGKRVSLLIRFAPVESGHRPALGIAKKVRDDQTLRVEVRRGGAPVDRVGAVLRVACSQARLSLLISRSVRSPVMVLSADFPAVSSRGCLRAANQRIERATSVPLLRDISRADSRPCASRRALISACGARVISTPPSLLSSAAPCALGRLLWLRRTEPCASSPLLETSLAT